MKRNRFFYKGSIIAMAVVLFFVGTAGAQDPFEVKWTMDYTQAGTSNHANFTPSDAVLLGGPNTYGLPTVYSTTGAIVAAYVIRPWPAAFSAGRCMEFTFTAKSFKYNISSISFRLRRSGNGPDQVKVRTSMDGFVADLGAYTITNSGQFNTYSVPVAYHDLSNNSFALRIYGFNASDIYGTLWFDEVKINGQVLAIILPIELTYLKATPLNEHQVCLDWETAWEKNSREFVIEKSTDLKKFAVAGLVPARGETYARTAYHFIDDAPSPGISYYRLRSVDRTSAFSVSGCVSVSRPEKEQGLQVFPNPAGAEKWSVVTGNGLGGTFTLTTISGHSIPFRLAGHSAGQADIYPANPLKSGIYFLTYQKNGRKEQVKVLVP